MDMPIKNFSSLSINNFYKVIAVNSYKTAFSDNQIVYTLVNGERLFGRTGIDKKFCNFTVPFYFEFLGRSEGELFASYKFNIFGTLEDFISKNLKQIHFILYDYITQNVCNGCKEKQPNQEAHICVSDEAYTLAETYLSKALAENDIFHLDDITSELANSIPLFKD